MPGGYGTPQEAVMDMAVHTYDSLVDYGVNTALASEQRSWNRQMYDYMNEYNKPINQKKRYLEAGINPYAAMTQGQLSSGNASSPPEGVAPPYGDYSPGLSGVLDRASQRDLNAANTRHLNSESKLNETDAMTRNMKNITEIANMRKQGLISDEEYNRLLNENNAFGIRLQNEMRAADDAHDLAEFEKSLKALLIKYYPKIQDQQLNVLMAQASDLFNSAKSHDADATLKAAQKLTEEAKKNNLEIEGETAKGLQDALIDEANQKSNEAYWRYRNARKEAGKSEHTYGIGPFKGSYVQMDSDPANNDPNHRPVHYDKHGPYILDERNQFKKIYLNGYKGQ